MRWKVREVTAARETEVSELRLALEGAREKYQEEMARRAESADAENNVMMRERDNLLAEKDTLEVLERQVETSWALKEASIVTIDIIK